MPRTPQPLPAADSFDAFLAPSDVEQIYIVLSLAKQVCGNDVARGMQLMQEQPQTFARTAVAHQDAIARRHYGIASLFGVVVLAMVYVVYQAFTTPDVGVLGVVLPAAMACFAMWRMERSVHRGRQGNLLLVRLLDALNGQPYSYDAAAFAQFLQAHPALAARAQAMAGPEEMSLQHLAVLKWQELQLRARPAV